MINCLFTLRFDGSRYHGFQIQENAQTVQQVFQDALSRVLGELPAIKACSRTDSGVHAECFCVNAHIELTELSRLQYSLNSVLPSDVRVMSLREVPQDFHARYSAHSKTYEYRILNAPVMDPFLVGHALHLPYPELNCAELEFAAQAFVGEHDFTAFCGSKGAKEDMKRTVYSFSVEKRGPLVVFSVSANGFLYNMVRIMAGTLISVARKKLFRADIEQLLSSGQRQNACFTAPAHGLYLCGVDYGFEE